MNENTWANRADAELRDASLKGKPHLTLACGHLSPLGSGPLAESGRGWCPGHGVQEITEGTCPGGGARGGQPGLAG